jgi:hypothetical protein
MVFAQVYCKSTLMFGKLLVPEQSHENYVASFSVALSVNYLVLYSDIYTL